MEERGEKGIHLDSTNNEEYTDRMQLFMFRKKQTGKQASTPVLEPTTPEGQSSIMVTLTAYKAYLQSSGYSDSTIEKYYGDIAKMSMFFRKKIGEITTHDVQQYIGSLLSPRGEKLDRKTVNRKVSAIINYFSWLTGLGALKANPTDGVHNARVQSPLPDYLYETEIKQMYAVASKVPRTYLIVLLLLEIGMKTQELLTITTADVDVSDAYRPELWIKHKGKQVKKDRKVALPQQFVQAYTEYIDQYHPEEVLFPYTIRFIQDIFAELKKQTKIERDLTPKTLRHTHVVRAYKRGENKDIIFARIGLAPNSRQEADEIYAKLASKGI